MKLNWWDSKYDRLIILDNKQILIVEKSGEREKKRKANLDKVVRKRKKTESENNIKELT